MTIIGDNEIHLCEERFSFLGGVSYPAISFFKNKIFPNNFRHTLAIINKIKRK